MMIKNEEKNLRRCLDSLHALRESIPSELIIVDTGSEDNSVSIAKEYTESVYFHPWDDDFSGMRNTTIGYARGSWVFIIDADEELEEDQGIIDFFKRDIPKNIAGAVINAKNLTSSQIGQSKYIVSLKTPRIFRKTKDFHYDGIIHNIPVVHGTLVEIEATLLHYGYIANDRELMERKFQRTSSLLKKVLEKNPNDIYYRFQLTNSYAMYGDHFNAFQEIQKAYLLCEKDSVLRKHIYVAGMLLKEALANQYVAEDVFTVAQRAILLEPEYFDIYFYLAQYHAMRQEYKEALACFDNYFSYVNKFDELSVSKNLSLNHYTLHSQKEAMYNVAAIFGKMGDFSEANRRIAIILDDVTIVSEIGKPLLDLVRISAFETDEFSNLVKIYGALQENSKEKNEFEAVLEKAWVNFSVIKRNEFSESMKNVDSVYGQLNYLRSLELQKWREDDFILAEELIKKENASEHYWYAWLGLAYHEQNVATQILDNMTENAVLTVLSYLDQIDKEKLIQICSSYIRNLSEQIELSYYDVKRGKIASKYLLFSQKWSESEYSSLFLRYSQFGKRQMRMLYTDFVIENAAISEFKTVEEAFLCYLILAEKTFDYEKVNHLNNAIKVFPEMSQGVKVLLENILQSNKTSKENSGEMDALKCVLYEKVSRLIEEGSLDEAERVLNETEEIAGVDLKLLKLRSAIVIQKKMF